MVLAFSGAEGEKKNQQRRDGILLAAQIFVKEKWEQF